jgi:hypothetical protein
LSSHVGGVLHLPATLVELAVDVLTGAFFWGHGDYVTAAVDKSI